MCGLEMPLKNAAWRVFGFVSQKAQRGVSQLCHDLPLPSAAPCSPPPQHTIDPHRKSAPFAAVYGACPRVLRWHELLPRSGRVEGFDAGTGRYI